MLHRRNLWIAVALVAWMIQPGFVAADIVIGYTAFSTAGSLPADASGSGVTPASVSRGPSVNSSTAGSNFRSTGFTTSNGRSPLDYLEWGFTSTVPYDLTNVQIAFNRETLGPQDVDIRLATNGGVFGDIGSVEDFPAIIPQSITIDLSSFTNITEATFRIFPHDSTDVQGGTPGEDRYFDLVNNLSFEGVRSVVVNGVAVPEPSAFLFGLAVCGCAGLGAVVRSRISAKSKLDKA